MKNYLIKNKNRILLPLGSLVLMWLAWIIAYYAAGNDYVIPSFQDTFLSLFKCFAEGSFYLAFLTTLLRTLGAFAVSFVIAVGCAALSRVSGIFKGLIPPVITVIRTLPALAVILIILIWTNARIAPVIVTFLLLFPAIYSQISAAVEGVDTGLLQMAKVYNVSKKDRLFKIYLPMASPAVFAQTGANISLGLKVTVSAEVMANTYISLGGLMQSARSFLEMPRLAALTIITVLAGFLIEAVFSRLNKITAKRCGRKV